MPAITSASAPTCTATVTPVLESSVAFRRLPNRIEAPKNSTRVQSSVLRSTQLGAERADTLGEAFLRPQLLDAQVLVEMGDLALELPDPNQSLAVGHAAHPNGRLRSGAA